jgi:hypothetical protein
VLRKWTVSWNGVIQHAFESSAFSGAKVGETAYVMGSCDRDKLYCWTRENGTTLLNLVIQYFNKENLFPSGFFTKLLCIIPHNGQLGEVR